MIRFTDIKEIYSISRLAQEIDHENILRGKERVRYWMKKFKMNTQHIGKEIILSVKQAEKIKNAIKERGYGKHGNS